MSRTIEAIRADLERARQSGDPAWITFWEGEERLAIMRDIPTPDLETLCSAWRDGRCAVLPCKVGDTVWQVGHETYTDSDGATWSKLRADFAYPKSLVFSLCHIGSIGTLYWLTKKECQDKIDADGIRFFGEQKWNEIKAQREAEAALNGGERG